MKRFKELIDFTITPEMNAIKGALQKQDSISFETVFSQPTINMMNTRYFIVNTDAAPVVNRGALGNVWFANEVKMVPNADSEIAAVRNFNPRTTAVVDERFKDQLTGFTPSFDSAATIALQSYRLNNLVYKSTSSTPQLAVFSEIYYDKGWNVYLDGQKTDYFRADYVLRAMKVPAGTHTIEWKFEPEVYSTGETVSLLSSGLIILLMVGAAFMEWRKKSPITKA